MMEFQTKIVKHKKNPRARVAAVGVGVLVAGMILACIRGHERQAIWAFGIGMALLIGGAIYAKGDLTSIEVSMMDLVVNVSEIRIGEVVYPLDRIEDLAFSVEGYDKCGSPVRGIPSIAGEKAGCRFYLPDARHVQLLGGCSRSFMHTGSPLLSEIATDGGRSFLHP